MPGGPGDQGFHAPSWVRIAVGTAASAALGVFLLDMHRPSDVRLPYVIAFAFLAPAAASLAADLGRSRPRLPLAAATGAAYGALALFILAVWRLAGYIAGTGALVLFLFPWAGLLRARADRRKNLRREVVYHWLALFLAFLAAVGPQPLVLEPLGLTSEQSIGGGVGGALTASLVIMDVPLWGRILDRAEA